MAKKNKAKRRRQHKKGINRKRDYEEQWFYDFYLEKHKEDCDIRERGLNIARKLERKNGGYSELVATAQKELDTSKKVFRLIEESSIIRVGPATLESLANRTPETYDYIKDGKLPFDSN